MLHLGGLGAVLGGEGEDPRPLDADLPQKVAELRQFLLPLAGKAGDEAGAEDQARDALPELSEEGQQLRLGVPAVHGLQDAVVAVLDGDIQVGNDLLLPGHGVDELLRHLVGIEVVEPDPVEVQLAELPQELRQLVLPVEVGAVAGDVLGDDDELFDPGGGQLRRLVQQLRHGAAAVLPPQGRDHAVGAAVVAALRDAEVGVPGRCGEDPGSPLLRRADVAEVAGPEALGHHLVDGLGDVAVAAGAEDPVYLRQLPQDILLVALGHAAGDENFPHLPGLLQLRHLQNVLNGLLAGGGQEAAGVHHHHVGPLGASLDGIAGGLGRRHHLLAVHLVFGAAQGNKRHVICHSQSPSRPGRGMWSQRMSKRPLFRLGARG